jgi:asparagine synthase (glutamine-hydrolysing)
LLSTSCVVKILTLYLLVKYSNDKSLLIMNICLSKLSWYNNNDIWVTGFIRENNRYLKQEDLFTYFKDVDTAEEFEKKLFLANGQFSVIIKRSDELWAATDRLRNYPLFYTRINGDFVISDDCYILADLLPVKSLDSIASDCFLSIGFTVNNLTLLDSVNQIEAGEYICEGNSFSRIFYHKPSIGILNHSNYYSASEELNKLFNEVLRSHLVALKDKFIAVPLSGGYDSRLIASMCAKYHPDNILCYTYGISDNREVAPAREAAKRLGLKWINVIYDSSLIDGYLNDGYFNDYYPYASNLSSMFYLQDYFAVKYLKVNCIIPDDSVFMPGFSGDSLGGSFFTSAFKSHNSKMQISKQILNDKFVLINLDKQKKDKIRLLIEEKIHDGIRECWKNYEEWEIKEMHSKFIINSAKVFSFFGYDYVLPLFDNQLIDFFTALPFDFKLNKRLYDYVLTHYIFRELNVNLPDEINPGPVKKSIQRVKEKIKIFVPNAIINNLIDLKSPILYEEITRILIEEIGTEEIIHPRQANYYNSYLTQWYLKKTREKLKLD